MYNEEFTLLSNKIELKKSYKIHPDKDGYCSVDDLEKRIDQDFPAIDCNLCFNVVYFYSLQGNSGYNYPNGTSSIIYIGHSVGQKKNGTNQRFLGYRFKHCKEGKDCKSNETLRYYYKRLEKENDEYINLNIYQKAIEDKNTVLEIEQQARRAFLKKYKAYPIADGASYKK